MKRKLLVIGGHVTPALAVIDGIIAKFKSDVDIIFVGRKTVNRKEMVDSFEYREVKNRRIRFLHLETGRINRVISLHIFYDLFKIFSGITSAYRIIQSEKPNIILSFGGYLAFPLCLVGYLRGIPVFTHEQTIKPGLTNTLIGTISKRVFVSFPEASRYFAQKKVVFTGNPIRKSVLLGSKELPQKKNRCIYITGGSMGSHSINLLVEEILEKLLSKFNIIHQTGNVTAYQDYERLNEKKRSLPTELASRYSLFQHLDDADIIEAYSQADIIVGRSGANTIFELIVQKKPAILIPLPWSARDEQLLQAKLLERAGVAEIFDQSESGENLFRKITDMMLNVDKYKHGFKDLSYLINKNATDQIIEYIF